MPPFLLGSNLAGAVTTMRHTSNHESTTREIKHKANVMSTVDMFSPEIAAHYGRKMVEIVSGPPGSGAPKCAIEAGF